MSDFTDTDTTAVPLSTVNTVSQGQNGAKELTSTQADQVAAGIQQATVDNNPTVVKTQKTNRSDPMPSTQSVSVPAQPPAAGEQTVKPVTGSASGGFDVSKQATSSPNTSGPTTAPALQKAAPILGDINKTAAVVAGQDTANTVPDWARRVGITDPVAFQDINNSIMANADVDVNAKPGTQAYNKLMEAAIAAKKLYIDNKQKGLVYDGASNQWFTDSTKTKVADQAVTAMIPTKAKGEAKPVSPAPEPEKVPEKGSGKGGPAEKSAAPAAPEPPAKDKSTIVDSFMSALNDKQIPNGVWNLIAKLGAQIDPQHAYNRRTGPDGKTVDEDATRAANEISWNDISNLGNQLAQGGQFMMTRGQKVDMTPLQKQVQAKNEALTNLAYGQGMSNVQVGQAQQMVPINQQNMQNQATQDIRKIWAQSGANVSQFNQTLAGQIKLALASSNPMLAMMYAGIGDNMMGSNFFTQYLMQQGLGLTNQGANLSNTGAMK